MPKPLSERLHESYGGNVLGTTLREAQKKSIEESIDEANALIEISSPRACAEMIDSLVKFFFSENEGYFTHDENHAPEIRKVARSIISYVRSLTNMQDIKAIFHQFEKHGDIKEADLTRLAQEIIDSTDEEKTLLSVFGYFHVTYTENISGSLQIKNPIALITFSTTKKFYPEERIERGFSRPSSNLPSLGRLLPKLEEVQTHTQDAVDDVVSNPDRQSRRKGTTKATPKGYIQASGTIEKPEITTEKTRPTLLSERQWAIVDTSEADAERERLESNYAYIVQEIESLKDFIVNAVPFLKELGEYFELQEKKEELESRKSRLNGEKMSIEEGLLRTEYAHEASPAEEATDLSEARFDLGEQQYYLQGLTLKLEAAEKTETLKYTLKNIRLEIENQRQKIEKTRRRIGRIENPRGARRRAKKIGEEGVNKIEDKDNALKMKNIRMAEVEKFLAEIEAELEGVKSQGEKLRIQRAPTLDEFNNLFLQSFGGKNEVLESETAYIIRPEYPRNVILDKLISLIEGEDIGTEGIDINEILRIKEVFEHGDAERKREELDAFSQGKCHRYIVLLESWVLEKMNLELEIALPEREGEFGNEEGARPKGRAKGEKISGTDPRVTEKNLAKQKRRDDILAEIRKYERSKRAYIFYYDERIESLMKDLMRLRESLRDIEGKITISIEKEESPTGRNSLGVSRKDILTSIEKLEEERKILSIIMGLRESRAILRDQKEYTEIKNTLASLSRKLSTIR